MQTHVTTPACALALALLCATPAFAHHPGGIGNSNATGPINTLSATTPAKGDLSAGLSFESTSFDGLTDATLESAAEDAVGHAHVHSLDILQMTALDVAYGLSDNVMVSLRVPYLMRDGVRTGHFHGGEAEVEDGGEASGIGDVTALLQWRVMRGADTDVSLFGGVKAPTGEDDLIDDLGEAFATEFQPSSRAWDYSAGVAVTRRIAHLSLDASGLYTFTGEHGGDDLGDRFAYGLAASYRVVGHPVYTFTGEHGGDDLGDRFAYGLAASYRVVGHPPHHQHMGLGAHDHGVGVDLVAELNGEWHGAQKEGGETDPNSGGHVLYFAPGVRLVHEGWAGHLSVGGAGFARLGRGAGRTRGAGGRGFVAAVLEALRLLAGWAGDKPARLR